MKTRYRYVLAVLMVVVLGCAEEENNAPFNDTTFTEEKNETTFDEEKTGTRSTEELEELNNASVEGGEGAITAPERSEEVSLPEAFPDSMKGYEIYSWDMNGEWYFTLITGTNRNKTDEEIIAPENTVSEDGSVKVTVIGEAALLDLLSRLPNNTYISWCTSDSPVVEGTVVFSLPDGALVERVKEFCTEHGLNLSVPSLV